MNAIKIELDIVPPTATAQQKGAFVAGGRIRFFTKRKVREAENFLAALIAPYAPPKPIEGAVRLDIEWRFPYRKSEPKRVTNAGADVRHTVRPDLDNLEKSLIDTMTRLGFWRDDAQIADKRTSKFRSAKSGLAVTVTALDGSEVAQ